MKNVDITVLHPRGGGKLSEIKGFSLNGPIVWNSFPHTCIILNLFQNLSAVVLNLFQHLKNFISRIGVSKYPKQAKNRNVMTSSLAFTLAETLITIGMIGVIAALTLPTLMNSTNDKEIVAKAKKTYAALNEAYGRAYAKYGPVTTWYTSSDTTDALKAQRLGRRMTEFMQVEKDCGTGTGCWTNAPTKFLSGSATFNFNTNTDFYKVILGDGTSLVFRYAGGSHVGFDIDGPNKGKNIAGNDFFYAYISGSTNRVATVNHIAPGDAATYCRTKTNTDDWTACLKWVLNYDNVDYLQTDSSGKCPNGTTLSDSNPTCN